MFSTDVSDDGSVVVCEFCGDLDAFTATELRSVLADLSHSPSVIIDLSGVVFIDSAGLGALVGGIRRTRELGGEVVLCRPRGAVERVLRVAGLSRIVTIAESREAAFTALSVTAPG